jgi:hypothetical protein
MPLTRRDLLHRVAAAGGASLVYQAAGLTAGDELGKLGHKVQPRSAGAAGWSVHTIRRGTVSDAEQLGCNADSVSSCHLAARLPRAAGAGRSLRGNFRQNLGDHMNLNTWMQGAFESGRQVATAIHARSYK